MHAADRILTCQLEWPKHDGKQLDDTDKAQQRMIDHSTLCAVVGLRQVLRKGALSSKQLLLPADELS